MTDFRDRSRVRVLRWSAVSLALHLVVTQLSARLEVGAMLEPTNSTAPSVPLVSEIPLDLGYEAEIPKEMPKASPPAKPVKSHAPPMKSNASTRSAPEDSVPAQAGKAHVSADRTAVVVDQDVAAGRATGAETESSEAGAGTTGLDAGSSFADLEPSRPGDRLMFDPFRASRDRSSGGVRVLIDTARLRRHPLGALVGQLLARVDSSGLLGPTGIDPIGETERIFIYAPTLRESSGLVLMIQHRLALERLRARLDGLVDSVPDAGGMVDAELRAPNSAGNRSDRAFIMPTPGILIVAPESVGKSAEPMTSWEVLPATPSPSIVWAHIETPWRAFLGTPFVVPRSLRWLEVRIAPVADGGMVARLEAEDEDEASAALDARRLAVSVSDGLAPRESAEASRDLSPEQVPSIEFHATHSIIVGTCRFTEAQIADFVERVRGHLDASALPSHNP